MKKISIGVFALCLMASCVSKKKYVALEQENSKIKNELSQTTEEKDNLEAKFNEIQSQVDGYNSKISALTKENNAKMVAVDDVAVISNDARNKMNASLANVDPAKLSEAKTLKDSMNLAVSYNLQKSLDNSSFNEDEDIAINIDKTVVMVSISDKMLFTTASYRVNSKANAVLKKLAAVINSDPSVEVMVEGHTDARSISSGAIKDNWDLSVLRATSVVRKLQNDYDVAPEKMIAAGRSSYFPVAKNDTKENRAKNRRTRFVIIPNINKFFDLMDSEATPEVESAE